MWHSFYYQQSGSGILTKEFVYVNNLSIELLNDYNIAIEQEAINIELLDIDFKIETENIVIE